MPDDKSQLDSGVPVNAEPANLDILAVRNRLVDTGLLIMAILGPPVLILSIYRVVETGWNPIFYLQIGVIGMIIPVALLRKRIAYRIRASVLLGVLLLLGAAGLMAFGLVGGGTIILFTFAMLTTIAFGTSAGLIACGISMCVIGAVGWGICTGVIPLAIDSRAYETSFTSWLLVFAGFGFFVSIIVMGLGILHKRLVSSLRALGQSEARLRRIMDNLVGSFIYQHDVNATFNYISRSIENVLGYEPDEFLNDINTYLTDHPVNDEVRKYTELSIKGIQQPPYEVQIRHKDGSIHWLEVSETPMRDDAGQVVGVEGIAHDITDRKRMEATLRKLVEASSSVGGPEFFESMVIQLSESLDADCTLIGELDPHRSETIRTLAVAVDGKPGENFQYDLEGTPCQHVIGHTVCSYKSGVAAEFPQDVLLAEMGVEAYVGVPLFDSKGSPTGVMAALFKRPMKDMTLAESVLQIFSSRVGSELESQRFGKALQASENNYRTLTDVSPVGVFKTDAAGKYLYTNDRWSEISGAQGPQTLGEGWTRTVHPDDLDTVMSLWSDAIGGGRRFEAEYRFKPFDDSVTWVFAQATPELDQAGQTVGYVGSITDISERKHLEGQLRQSQKMEAIGKLAGGVAHDFNNLLQVILGFGELAFAEAAPGGVIHDGLDQILAAGKRAAALVRQLLAFSRQQVLRLDDLDVHEVVSDLAKMMRRVIGEDVDLDIRSQPGQAEIRADRGQIEQILMNLCVNARDAMPDGGTLILETASADLDAEYCLPFPWASPGRYAMLSVTDTGFGMDSETQQRIFEPFFTTKGLDKGTGLGLSTVYGIVQQHHGIINVYSEPGIGSSFQIYFPIRTESSGQGAPAELSRPQGGTETILIAEDDESVRLVAERFLTDAGYAVLSTRDGREAIGVFDENSDRIDLVLLDVVMPELGGQAVFDHIRSRSPKTCVLFASGYSSSGVHAEAVLSGETTLIQKPYRRNELLSVIRKTLDARE